MKRILLAVALFITPVAFAQAPPRVTFTASHVQDSGGSTDLPTGKLCFVTTDANDKPMGYRIGSGSGQTSASPGQAPCVQVTAGNINPIQLINSAASSPVNACVRVVTLNAQDQEIRRSKCVQTGTTAAMASWCSTDGTNVTCNWDRYPVGTEPVAQLQIGPQGQQGIQGPQGIPGQYTSTVGVITPPVAWSATPTYRAGQMTTYSGTTYIAVADSSNVTPGTDATKWQAAGQLAQTIANITPHTTFEVFGDSHTACYNLTGTQCWVNYYAQMMGVQLGNNAIFGSMCQDQAPYFMAVQPKTSSFYGMFLAFNDMRVVGTDAGKLAEYRGCLLAGLAKLGTPQTAFVPAQSCASSAGSWTNETLLGIAARFTATASSSLTCSVGTGQAVVLFGLGQFANTSVFKVKIDGQVRYCSPQSGTCGSTSSEFSESSTVKTVLGATYGPRAWLFSGLTNTPHSIEIEATTPDATNFFHVLGAVSLSPSTATLAGPSVIVGTSPRMNSNGYAQTCAGPVNCNVGSDAAVAAINEYIDETSAQLASFGVQVNVVHLNDNSILNPDDGTCVQGDNVHFTAKCHFNWAQAVWNETTGIALARDRGVIQALRGISSWLGSIYAGGSPPINASVGQLGTTAFPDSGMLIAGADGGGFRRSAAAKFGVSSPQGISTFFYGGEDVNYPATCVGGSPAFLYPCRGDGTFDGSEQDFVYAFAGTTVATDGAFIDEAVTYPHDVPTASYTLTCTLDGTGSNSQAVVTFYNPTVHGATLRLTNTAAVVNTGKANCHIHRISPL